MLNFSSMFPCGRQEEESKVKARLGSRWQVSTTTTTAKASQVSLLPLNVYLIHCISVGSGLCSGRQSWASSSKATCTWLYNIAMISMSVCSKAHVEISLTSWQYWVRIYVVIRECHLKIHAICSAVRSWNKRMNSLNVCCLATICMLAFCQGIFNVPIASTMLLSFLNSLWTKTLLMFINY